MEYRRKFGSGSDKWEGSNIVFIWALTKGNKGFSVFLSATGKANKTFEFDGIAYFFERENNGWKTTKKLDMNGANKTLSKEEIANKFPKRGSNFRSNWGLNSYWNFLDDQGQNMKNDANVGNQESQTVLFSSSGGNTNVDAWTANLNDWWSYFFDNSKWNMADTVKNISGTWT